MTAVFCCLFVCLAYLLACLLLASGILFPSLFVALLTLFLLFFLWLLCLLFPSDFLISSNSFVPQDLGITECSDCGGMLGGGATGTGPGGEDGAHRAVGGCMSERNPQLTDRLVALSHVVSGGCVAAADRGSWVSFGVA